jgi:aryl-alcohol dehydrogenase
LLVRVVACGICHTDVACRDADIAVPLPIVLGHEGAGIVEQVGSAVNQIAIGDSVLLSFSHCGSCPTCSKGLAAYCDHFGDLNFGGNRADGSATLADGVGKIHGSFFGQSAFASHVVVRSHDAVAIAAGLPLDALAPLGCSALTGAGAVLNVLRPAGGDSIAVFGVGPVGLAAVMAAKIAGCRRIVAVDRIAERLRAAADFGATHTVLAGAIDELTQAVRDASGPVSYAIDTTGNGEVIAAAAQSLDKCGTCLMLGVSRPGVRIPLDARVLVRNGLSLRGVVEGDSLPRRAIPLLIKHFTAGQFPLDRLIKRYAFADINQAIADAASCATLKPVLIL